MLESISITTANRNNYSVLKEIKNNKVEIDLSIIPKEELNSLSIKITFKKAISEFRNHDYTWVKLNKDRISAEFSPKIIKLDNKCFVQANLNIGFWEIKKKNPKVLEWKFNPKNSAPLAIYVGLNSKRKINQANRQINLHSNPKLLFSSKSGIEFSRSINPFSAIVCFTDHCDFDTSESIKLQRLFFKTNSIKTTKGFFLNHYSKRDNNTSFEKDSIEMKQWTDEGHELAYHSLSQSIKSEKDSFDDFFNYKPPLKDITTWIDHGYQPYNLSLFQKNKIDTATFSKNMKDKKIATFWNYIDSGTSSEGVINQLNIEDFTLNSFYKGIKTLPFRSKMALMIKNIIFHYYADESMILKYKNTAKYFKNLIYKKKNNSFLTLLFNFISLSISLLKIFIFWKTYKNKPYKYAKYSPLLFKNHIDQNEFYIFQTIEMIDFKKSLQVNNIEKLITEKGIFIAHTYFSVPFNHHTGKMFEQPDKIDRVVAENFNYLGNKIKSKEIWNPTLNELKLILSNFEKTELDIDNQENIIVIKSSDLLYRLVN